MTTAIVTIEVRVGAMHANDQTVAENIAEAAQTYYNETYWRADDE
jgi:hypothetical protein